MQPSNGALRPASTIRGARDVARAVVPDRLHQPVRFGAVGAVAFVVDVGTFNLLRLLEVGPLTSKALAVVLATTVAYAGNRRWTFRERRVRSEVGGYATFFVINGLGLLITLACLGTSYYLLGLTSPLAENVSANGVGLALGMLFRWWAYRRFVFHLDHLDVERVDPRVTRHVAEGENAGHAPGPRLVRSRT
jgi:putative flippase GtrA